ncbi:nucleotidyltransferase family protein [Butyricicoccus sp. OF27-2pH9A]|uniref:nucleotidyltransferase family protein n=1 Tax=Butyricicoccus sp. OF27-2pH9A TaxID=3002517 RepID=UPI0022E33E83|nr:nucleotidyltransferase domain-containing protein [Butyricicoccus sp. OF27-2pH9A]
MDKTIEQVKQLAHRCRVPKLVLFGSRARGDHHARSDYDFALWGCTPQQRVQFSDAVENDLDSLYSVDLVFVSEHTDAALLQNIEKDGICLLDRYNTIRNSKISPMLLNAYARVCKRTKRIRLKSFATV